VAFEYKLEVYGPSGAFKGEIIQTNAVFSVDSYDVAPDGNCLEATFRMKPGSGGFTIALRDVVFIFTRPDGFSGWVPRYSGYVTLAGNRLSDKVETFRLVGLKQRFYERVPIHSSSAGLAGAVIAGADVASMAIDLFAASDANGNIVGVLNNAVDAPSLTFQQGDRFTQLQSIGDNLDALAASVGRFIVPTSETYAYDGVSFTAGQVVPPVTWGVRADGSRFFRRALQNVLVVNESDLDKDIQYPALSGEDVVNRPVLLYYPGMDLTNITEFEWSIIGGGGVQDLLPVFQPWTFRLNPINASDKVFQLPDPQSFLVDAQSLFTISTDTTSNGSNAYDGNSTTFASATNGEILTWQRSTVPLPEAFVGVSLDAEFGDDISIFVLATFFYIDNTNTGYFQTLYKPVAPTEVGAKTRLRIMFPFFLPAQVYQRVNDNDDEITTLALAFFAVPGPNANTGTAKIYDFRPFMSALPSDNSVATRLAEAYARPAVTSVANVKVYGEGELFTSVDVTPLVGSVIEAPVERVQYSITTAEGITTTYHAGQAFDGELVSERVVLEGLARRAVRS
jgi:hypothetical protein